jgi:hypothetical protein
MPRRWGHDDGELTLPEIFADPITQALMRAGGVLVRNILTSAPAQQSRAVFSRARNRHRYVALSPSRQPVRRRFGVKGCPEGCMI